MALVLERVSLAALAALAAAGCGGEAGSSPSSAGTGASGGTVASGGTSGGGGGASGGSVATGGDAGTVASGGTSAGGSAGAASGGGAAGTGGACAGSPSGYACDPWSVFLYPSDGVRRDTTKLRLQVHHDVELEGYPEDQTIAPGHDFSQVLTIELDLSPEVRNYLCSVLVPSALTTPVDPSKPEFTTTVNQYVGASLLATLPNDYNPHPKNVVDICGAGPLAQLVNPGLVASPTLPDIVLVLPLDPKPTGFQVGQTFSAWLARGVLWVDEESELSPAVTASIVEIL